VMATFEVDPKILRYYSDDWDEDNRIRSGLHQLELIRTQEILRRFLPDGGGRVLDVGGGAGIHAEWLLEDGHAVHLIDPVPRHVDLAVDRLGTSDRFTAAVGDGRDLEQPDGAFDAVLLLGPLYHLTDRADRMRSWTEALRVMAPGGLVFAVGISRFTELSVGLAEGLIFDDVFATMMERMLTDGQHRNPDDREYFTTAFYHHPSELEDEAIEAGWHVEAVLGIEGFARAMPQLEEHWEDPVRRQIIIDAARSIESEPSLLGLGPHVMVVARKPG
ncbi:MAG: methyltransferase domain-containing protein, partial [Actinomycetota bacterium]